MLTFFSRRFNRFKRLLIIVTFQLFLVTFSKAQEIEWQNTIGGNGNDELFSIQQTFDGGYILGGSSWSGISGDKTENTNGSFDYWIVKTDPFGNIQWQNTIGGSGDDYLRHIQQTTDGGFIIGGQSTSNISGDKNENSNGGMDYWIVKTDSIGNIQWQNTIGGDNFDAFNYLQQTADGGYILGGYSNSSISGDKTESNIGSSTTFDYWIIKTDTSGNLQWQNTIGGDLQDYLQCIQQTNDGGYILGGYSNSSISGDKTEDCYGNEDYWIVKTDASGNIQWQNTMGGSTYDRLNSIQQTSDGGYILGGYSQSNISVDKAENSKGGWDYWIVKIDPSGNIQWQNTIGGDQYDYLYSIQQSADGGYILGGFSESNISDDKTESSNGGNDYWIVKTDATGNVQWQNTIGGISDDRLYSIDQTSDGGYILGGYSNSNISGDKTENSNAYSDYWIIKLIDKNNLIIGNLYADFNSNNVHDIGEPMIINKKVKEQNTNRFSFSGQDGKYLLTVWDSGNFSVTPNVINLYNVAPIVHSVFFPTIHQMDSLNDFAFQPVSSFNDLCVTLTPLTAFRSGRNASYLVNYENLGTNTLNGTIKLFQGNVLSYISSTLAPISVNVDSVEWNVGTLTSFQSGSFIVTYNVSSGAPVGSNLTSHCVIEPIVNDANTSCNYDTSIVTVTGSYDPNDILVSEDTLLTTQLPTGPWLDYIIRFQNTGNDTAFTVKIINSIDTNKLELNSIEFVNSSHPVDLKWVNYNRNMEFLFSNILLPDSNVNEPMSHGFVHYRIKPKSTLLAGDSITNKAYIYFDFNAPVETNTAITKIVLTTGLTPNPSPQERGVLQCFPNPAKDAITIQLNNHRQRPTNNSVTSNPIFISIFDVYGKLVRKETTSNPKSEISNLQSLSSGVYFVEVKSGNDIYRAKFVKD